MELGEQLKIEGIELTASKHLPDLVRAQEVARLMGLLGNPITSDDVREAFFCRYGRELQIGSAIGALFEERRWECVGRVKSKRPQSHARYICSWKLRRESQ